MSSRLPKSQVSRDCAGTLVLSRRAIHARRAAPDPGRARRSAGARVPYRSQATPAPELSEALHCALPGGGCRHRRSDRWRDLATGPRVGHPGHGLWPALHGPRSRIPIRKRKARGVFHRPGSVHHLTKGSRLALRWLRVHGGTPERRQCGTKRPVGGSRLTVRCCLMPKVARGPGAGQGAQRRRAIACPPPGQAIFRSQRVDWMSCGNAEIKRAEIPSDRLPADMRWRGAPDPPPQARPRKASFADRPLRAPRRRPTALTQAGHVSAASRPSGISCRVLTTGECR